MEANRFLWKSNDISSIHFQEIKRSIKHFFRKITKEGVMNEKKIAKNYFPKLNALTTNVPLIKKSAN